MLQTAKFSLSHKIYQETKFNWWVQNVLKKQERIIAVVKKRTVRYHKSNYRQVIYITNPVKEDYAIDENNDNNYWYDAVDKQVKNMQVTFKILE